MVQIKQNEHLYETFKTKYDSAVDLINTIEEEKEKLQKNLKKMSNDHNYMCSYRGSYYEGQESPQSKCDISTDSPKLYEFKNHHRGSVQSDFQIHLPRPVNKFSLEKELELKNEFEKLKEDYFNLYEEKKFVEMQLIENSKFKVLYNEIKESLNSLQLQYDNILATSQKNSEEKNSLQDRLNKFSKDHFELVQNLSKLKETLNHSEKERNLIKTKFSAVENKNKTLEKEISMIRKKTQSLNSQIKDLREKLKEEMDDKMLLEKKYEDQIEELNNKCENLQIEKQNILKDSLSHIMMNLNDEKLIEFFYNVETNKIQIYYEKSLVTEVENKVSKVQGCKQTYEYSNFKECDKIQGLNNSLSPPRHRTEMKCEPFTEKKSNNFSLNNLFSKSKSSKKSHIIDKENLTKLNFQNLKSIRV
jgi:hypothetical protein